MGDGERRARGKGGRGEGEQGGEFQREARV